jgi:16S rRNA (guanine966-N2)-methyltransferase
MVEREPRVLAALRENAKTLQNPPGMEIIRGDALQYVASTKSKFDLIFLDPPFNKGWIARLEPLLASVANEGAAVYIEAEHEVAAFGAWRAVRHGKAGEVHYQLMRRETGWPNSIIA